MAIPPAQLTEAQAPEQQSTALLVGAMVILQLVGSICYPIAKYGLEIIDPFTFAFFRYLISSTVLLTIVRFTKRQPKVERRDWGRIVLLGVLIVPFNQTLFLVGQHLTGAGHGAFIFSTTPVWVFLLALIHLKEKTTWRRTLGIIMATAGVTVIMLSGAFDVGTEYLLGDAIILVAVLAWAYYTILGKKLVQKYGALRMTAYALAIGSAMYLPIGGWSAWHYDYSRATLAAWGSVAYMAIGLSGVVYVLWYWLLKYLDASRIAVYHNVQPIIASGLAYFFLGESLETAFVVGGLIIVSGVIITEI